MRDPDSAARAAALRRQSHALQREAAAHARSARAAVAEEARKLDAQQHEILSRPAAQLSEHCSQLASQVLHRELMVRY